MAAYTEFDQTDRRYFEEVLSDDIERLAFINFFAHVERDFARYRCPRTGNGRVKLWLKASRAHWLRRARNTTPFPLIHRQAPPAPASAPIVQAPPPPPPPPPAPLPPPLTLVVPIAAGTIEIAPAAKRSREEFEDAEETAAIEPPAKRRLPGIGGELRAPFVLHNNPPHATISPTKEQREHIQAALGGNWRFAKTLYQQSASQGGKRWGFPARSTYLFVKVDEAGVILDRVAVKCTDISRDDEPILKARVEREASVLPEIQTADCSHLTRYRRTPTRQNTNFTIEYANPKNKDPSMWTLHYNYTDFKPHGSLDLLIANHKEANRLIPEHFIWRVFQALVDGLLTCQTGFCSEQRSTKIVNAGDRLEGWRRILHLDIHPGNVLFGEADSKYPYYKAPVLADFDKAICLDSNPVRRRAQFDEARYDGRNHWQAPENSPLHRNLKEKHRPNQWLLDHATDVYSLGLVIRCMMCCTMDTAEKPWDGLHKAEGTNFYHRARGTIEDNDVEFPWSLYPAVYSSVLIRLALRCLAFLPQADPSRRKQHRISLFELRDIISTNLDRLDSMYGGAFEGAQSDRTHPLYVLVDEEDARFKVGGMFPVDFDLRVDDFDLRVDDFVDSEATTTAREKARPFFRDCQSLAHAAPIPENNSISELPRPSMEAMQKAIDETYAAVHQTQVAQAHSSERDTKVLALDHAITTIKKRVNPEGTFKQRGGGKDLKFYSPAQKLFTLASIETCCQERIKSSENELQEKIESIAARDEDIAAMDDDDLAEKEALQSIVDSARNRIPEMREGFDALKLLCEAANYGRSLLLLGKEADITEDTFDERWSEALSDAHRGVWDYFWSIPDGVMRTA